MTATRIGVRSNVLINYCHFCGRVYVGFNHIDGTWLESTKSIDKNLVNLIDIEKVLKRLTPVNSVSLWNKARISLIDDIRKAIKNTLKP